jgi:hypothetical protein
MGDAQIADRGSATRSNRTAAVSVPRPAAADGNTRCTRTIPANGFSVLPRLVPLRDTAAIRGSAPLRACMTDARDLNCLIVVMFVIVMERVCQKTGGNL